MFKLIIPITDSSVNLHLDSWYTELPSILQFSPVACLLWAIYLSTTGSILKFSYTFQSALSSNSIVLTSAKKNVRLGSSLPAFLSLFI